MVFGEEDDEEVQLLLSKPSRDALGRSKRQLAETKEIGEEVLRSLELDTEKVRGVKRKQERVSRHLDEAETSARAIERSELAQFVFVCLALCLVIMGLFALLIRMIVNTAK
jgi:Flp pilus assembly protein TadB